MGPWIFAGSSATMDSIPLSQPTTLESKLPGEEVSFGVSSHVPPMLPYVPGPNLHPPPATPGPREHPGHEA